MRQTLKVFSIGMQAVRRDAVMLVLIFAPFLMGLAFWLLVPLLNTWLAGSTGFSITPWYPLADALLMVLTPTLLTMSSAFLLLEECDEGTGAYFQITPAGRVRYLAARIGIPAVWGFVCSVLVAALFGLSAMPQASIFAGALVGTAAGVAVGLMITALAANRVEGLAVSKLSGIVLLGLVGAWLVPAPWRWACGFLPSFWLGELSRGAPLWPALLAGLFVSALWALFFGRRFLRKLG